MFIKRLGILLLLFSNFLLEAHGMNEYGGCKGRECEVRARTHAGWVCGRVRRADSGAPYASFRGVPYGRPPLGHRRFQELEPVVPWYGLFDATEDAPACPQTDFVYGRIPMQTKGQSEDCIYLNVHVPLCYLPKYPSCTNNKLLPVLVFIHGGILQSGAGLTDLCGPEYLMSTPIVFLSFNYRLNVFGFLSLNTKEIPGNQGFRDMVTLLKWVKKNIYAFGGDPNNVTLMGQSAGATAAHILALSDATKGLFKRIILMSCTAFPNFYTTSRRYAKDVTDMLLQELGINSTDPVFIHDQLTKLPLLKIMDANVAVQYKTGLASFNPVVDSKFSGITRILDKNPLTLLEEGKGNEYPAIVSFTNNEMDYAKWVFVRKNFQGVLEQDPTAIVEPRLTYSLPKAEVMEITSKIYEKYFSGGPPTLKNLMTYYTDLMFKHSAFKVAQWRVATGGAPLYMYEYSYDAMYSPVKEAHWVNYTGAAHLDDLAFIFRINSMMGDYITRPPKNKDDLMKMWMVFLITNFMTCGKPLCNDNVKLWPPVAKGEILYHEILEPFKVVMKGPTKEQSDIVEFFDSIDPEVRNINARLNAGWY